MDSPIKIGYSDYGDIWLKKSGDRIMLKRYTALDYEYMEDYIRDNHDIRGEWQDDVWNGNTEDGYDDWLSDYEYPYDDYFCYDSDTEEYYSDDCDDTMWDYFYVNEHTKEETIERVMERFNDDYATGNFEWANMNEGQMRRIIGEYYDDCKEWAIKREEAKKPHWNAFNYYK